MGIIEKAKSKIDLPNELNIYEIAKLWDSKGNKEEITIFCDGMYEAFKSKRLKGREDIAKSELDNADIFDIYKNIVINKWHFNTWLNCGKELFSDDCLLLEWWPNEVDLIAAPKLLPEELIQLGKPLPNILKSRHIAKLWSNGGSSQAYIKIMHIAVTNRNLRIQANGKKYSVVRYTENDFAIFAKWIYAQGDYGWANRFDVEIGRSDFREWLEAEAIILSENCLLKYWFADDLIQQKKSKNEQPVTEDFHKTLLRVPQRTDAWFMVILEMTANYYMEYEKTPNEVQAWCQLTGNPPAGYRINVDKDKGDEECLIMAGVAPLSHSGFKKRWLKYTN